MKKLFHLILVLIVFQNHTLLFSQADKKLTLVYEHKPQELMVIEVSLDGKDVNTIYTQKKKNYGFPRYRRGNLLLFEGDDLGIYDISSETLDKVPNTRDCSWEGFITGEDWVMYTKFNLEKQERDHKRVETVLYDYHNKQMVKSYFGFKATPSKLDNSVYFLRKELKILAPTEFEPDSVLDEPYLTSEYVEQTSDGGYIIVASILIKTDSKGNTEWQKDIAIGVSRARQLGYIKTGPQGNKEWQKDKVSCNNHQQYEVTCRECFIEDRKTYQTKDGGYIINDEIWLEKGKNRNLVVLTKKDRFGKIEWEKNFGSGDQEDRLWSIQQTADGGYVMTGRRGGVRVLWEENIGDVWLIKIDTSGNKEWEKYFGESSMVYTGRFVHQTSDGGYVITGEVSKKNVETDEWGQYIFLIKTDSNGNEEWTRTFGKPRIRIYGIPEDSVEVDLRHIHMYDPTNDSFELKYTVELGNYFIRYDVTEIVGLSRNFYCYRIYDEHEHRYYYYDNEEKYFYSGGEENKEQYNLTFSIDGKLAAYTERNWNELTYLVVVDVENDERIKTNIYGSFPHIINNKIYFASDPEFVTTEELSPEFRQIANWTLYCYDPEEKNLKEIKRFTEQIQFIE